MRRLPSTTAFQSAAFLLLALTVSPVPVDAQENSATTESSGLTAESPPEISLGIGGVWKLGHPCPVRVSIPSVATKATHLEVISVDGDGVEAIYRSEIANTRNDTDKASVNIRIGRDQADLTVRFVAGTDLLFETTFDPASVSERLDDSQPLVVAIGSLMGIEQLAYKTPSGKSSLSTTLISAANEVPTNAEGLGACDLLLISTGDTALLRQLSEAQWQALQDWVGSGGGCIVSLSDSVAQLTELTQLTAMLPGRIAGVSTILNPGPLESLVVTDEPLKSFPAVALEVQNVRIDLPLTDSAAQRLPWWTTYAYGHGTIRVVASDLNHPSLANWKDRRLLWERIVEPYFSRAMLESPEKEAALAQASSYLGYSDLVGQLRATLDRFATVQVVSFGQVAAMLIATLILVGPIDYFVSVKWLKRPQFSWLFSGASLIAVSVALTSYYHTIRPNAVLVNSAQIVDVDLPTNQIRGNAWFNVYSGEATTVDISANAKTGQPLSLDWQGLPGSGLGGLSSQLNIDRGMPLYTIDQLPNGGSQFIGVGIPASGTKCLVGSWSSELTTSGLAIDSASNDLRELSGVDQLQGYFTNPLKVDLRNALLFYHDWYYILNSRITAGERVVISADEIPKDVSRRLNRQKNVDGTVAITRWDAADRDNLDGLLELMMFYKAASGVNYASLVHRFQPRIDQSNLLQLNRAILVAQIDDSPITIDVQAANQIEGGDKKVATEPNQQSNRTWCRIVFPVQGKNK